MVDMTGYYIYCRAWVGFSPTFPYFDELNPLPDEELIRKLNNLARQWLRENRSTAKQRYRDEAIALDALAKEIRKWKRSSNPRGIPNMSSYEKSVIIQNLNFYKRSQLLQEAERYGVQLALSDHDLRAAILDAMEKEHLQREFEKRRGEHQLYSQDVRDRFDVKKRVRGDKKTTSLETRIARIAGWTTEDIGRFGYFSLPPVKILTCGVSPTPKLMLRWVFTGAKVDEFAKVANSRFQRYDWNHVMIKVGGLSYANLRADELTMIDQQQREDLDPDSKWTGTP